jgi:hypothetical protein
MKKAALVLVLPLAAVLSAERGKRVCFGLCCLASPPFGVADSDSETILSA